MVPAWHPDFRNFDRLPDVKVVRTAFYTNGISIVVVLIMFFWLGYREYLLHDLTRQIADWQRQIDHDLRASTVAVGQYKKFQTEGLRVAEVERFIKSKPRFSEIVLRLAETLPANVALDGLDFRESAFNLRGTVRGTPDLAAGYASTYLQLLKSDAVFSEKFSEITLAGLNPNPQTGRLQLEIKLQLREGKKP
ncbi:MAG: hypothetical protein H7343_22405 [Undibacterium sp.]|nr:hypothetical protein [Opitutaceae bacterium]